VSQSSHRTVSRTDRILFSGSLIVVQYGYTVLFHGFLSLTIQLPIIIISSPFIVN
jgi:hypothetical protein